MYCAIFKRDAPPTSLRPLFIMHANARMFGAAPPKKNHPCVGEAGREPMVLDLTGDISALVRIY